VDDEPSICAIIAGYLEDEGYEVVTASKPLEALETFLAARFDVVITDRDMPDLSGEQVSALVKARSPGTPVIMVTSHGARMEMDGECPRQVDVCIGKPFDPQRLLEAVRKAVPRGAQPDSASRCS
jgi:DNA-binding NtrC family response regulator